MNGQYYSLVFKESCCLGTHNAGRIIGSRRGNDGLLTFWRFVRGHCTVGAHMPTFTSAAELTGASVPAIADGSTPDSLIRTPWLKRWAGERLCWL